MLIKILLGVAVMLIIFLVVAAMQPAAFRITRSAIIVAPPGAVFPQINDFRNWAAWSPWEKLDPTMRKTFEGSSTGTGAGYAWAGNSKAGEGRMTITESRPNELINIRLEFIKPFAAVNLTEFTFKPEGSQTLVTWTMTGTRNFMLKAVGLFMNMDKLVGGDFEKGLAQLKTVVEAKQ